jgi:hypothetical protein
MSKWTLTITNQLSAPIFVESFKPVVLLSSESWVYSPFTHGTSFSLSLCCPLLGSCALMHGSVACRVIFTWHWPLGKAREGQDLLRGSGQDFKIMFHYLNIIFYFLKLMTMCIRFDSFTSIWCHFIHSFYKFMFNIIVYFTIWK